ncbi:hypothetical protein NQ315_011602 [Exocentrus adspersus]|uniref:C2H2-type domain-containing protein n=1 Tax=Exocentrus adspersus TaxID=1586481 RepID=A0AAV8VVF2_9CUCU|nr:hypothetical protein NQ315_011602 [Exocentrus adspersus]
MTMETALNIALAVVNLIGSLVLQQRRNTLVSKWDFIFEESPKEWIGFKPSLGSYVYPCYACRNMFSCLSSFQDHINRRIIVLKYNCSGCANKILTFYNRCSFLLHTRKHFTLNEGAINLCEVDIFTLPVSLAGFLPHPNIPLLYPRDEEEVSEGVYINTQFYYPDVKERGKQIVTLKPNDIIFTQPQMSLALRQVCLNVPRCNFITVEYQKLLRRQNLFVEENNNVSTNPDVGPVQVKEEPPNEDIVPAMTMPVISKVESIQESIVKLPKCLDCNTFQKGSMTEHYLGKNSPTDESLKCEICKFVASTKCSLNAHIRIHENVPPFVCPDCGIDFPNWPLLRKHMDDVCFHLVKHVRFRCPGKRCGKLFAVTATFSQHFQGHMKSFYACSRCSSVTYEPAEADAHKLTHQEPCIVTKFYECPVCPHVGALTEDNYKDHITIHTSDTSRGVYVYMCKYCRSYFRSTATYATHVIRCSAKHTTQVVKKYDIPKYVTKQCEKCTNKIIFNAQKPSTLCNKCKQQSDNAKATANKRYFCILCTNQIQLHEKSYHIKQCAFGKPHILLHKLTEEDIENMSFSCSSSSDFDSSSSPVKSDRSRRRKSSDSSKTDESAKKKRRRSYHPNPKPKKSNERDLTAEEPMQFNGTYHCKLCDYENTDRASFHSHIKEHRDISTAYQCMECAECFVVKPSLIKHLLHFHNISDYESYLVENDCFDVDAVKQLESIMRLAPGESKEPVEENQCSMCRLQFQDALSLSKHFRIHGMAFLLKNTK